MKLSCSFFAILYYLKPNCSREHQGIVTEQKLNSQDAFMSQALVTMMKVLLNDGMDEEGIKLFENAGIETDNSKLDPKGLVKQIGKFDALVVRSATKVTREVIESGIKGKLKVIGRAGVGTDNIDINAAIEMGLS